MIKRVKEKDYFAYMEPGVSAEACLYCDLEIDPGSVGIQSYEVSQLLYYGHEPNSFGWRYNNKNIEVRTREDTVIDRLSGKLVSRGA